MSRQRLRAGSATISPTTSIIVALSRVGRPGRELATGLDVARSTSPGYTWRRARNHIRAARSVREPSDPGYRHIWTEAARELDAEVAELSSGFLEIRANGAWTRVWRQWVMLDDAVTLRFALDKPLIQHRLSSAGLPVPPHLEFASTDRSSAAAFLAQGPVPCVVKPAASSGGSGVTCQIRTRSDLARACILASRADRRLMIERQGTGAIYRLLFLDGVLLDVVRKRPPCVTGDGRSSIEQLIAAENRRLLADQAHGALWPIRVDLDCILTLKARRLSLASVLPADETVAVKTVISQGGNEKVPNIAPEVEHDARVAVECTGLRLAGVDVMTIDPCRPLAETAGVILEVNGTPGLHYHYDVSEPAQATRVAVPILRQLLR